MTGRGERIFVALLRLYPREFRARYHDDLVAFFRQDRAHPRYGSGPLRPIRFWSATLLDLARTAWRHRARPRPVAPFGRLREDLRDGWRGLWAARGVTVAALAVLTLAIGAGTAIFSVVDAVVLRGLPFADPDRLVSVAEVSLPGGRLSTVAWPNYADWRARQDVFDTMAASAHGGQLTTADAGPAERLRLVRITASLFDVLRIAPARGRRFTAADEVPGSPRVALISDALWRRRFHSRPDIVGQMLTFENGAVEVVGVMPRGFMYPLGSVLVSNVDFWMPFVPTAAATLRTGGRTYSLTVVARLRPGATLAHASAQMSAIRDGLAREHPRWFVDHGVAVLPLADAIVGPQVRAWMWLLLAAVGFVLLIACLNVANLLIARAAARRRELALRAALGATRWSLARALIIESVMLSLMGAALGVLVAFWGVALLRGTLPEHLPRLASVVVDLRVLGVTAAAALGTGLLFGTLPALQFARPNVAAALQQGGRSHAGGQTGHGLRTTLVVAEISLAVILLAGAGLFLMSFVRVLGIDLGLDPRQVIAIDISPRRPAPPAVLDRAASQAQVVAAMSGVQSTSGVIAAAALGGGLPLSGGSISVPIQLGGREGPSFTGDDEPFIHIVTSGYLDVVRGTLLRGRFILDSDVAGAPPVVVVSDEAVRRYFGPQDPLGRTVLLDGSARTVVGVVRAMRHNGPEASVRAELFVPYLQGDQPGGEIVFRAANPAPLLPRIQEIIRAAAPAAVVSEPQTIEGHFASLVAQRKFNMLVLALFGALAVLIAAAGIYGLMAFLVSQRTREIGVRIALGAVPAGVLRMVLGRASRLMLAGLAIGLAGAAALERLVRGFLFDARPHDPALYAMVAVVLLTAGLAAALGPARRAARVDPLIALRAE
jgi:putative ABC transport system permease protein